MIAANDNRPPVNNYGDPRLPDRFWAKVIPEPNSGCWLWIGANDERGYGRFGTHHADGRKFLALAHRFAYGVLVAPVAVGLHVDHLCRTPACCNPAHLEPVTPRENTLRGASPAVAKARHARVTHCPRGHEYDEGNTYIHHRADGYPNRICLTCARARTAARKAARDAA